MFIDLIASGYEWTCPKCDTLNKVDSVTPKVTCDNCCKSYDVNEYHHAID